MSVKVLIAVNTAWNLVNFRTGLIKALISRGYEVIAVAPDDTYVEKLPSLGCRYIPLPMDNKGTNPGRDLLLLWRFFMVIRSQQPDIYLGFTVKPNIYGSLAAHALNIPVINNIAGLGAGFTRASWLNRLVCRMYQMTLARSRKVFFQNNEDRSLFISSGLVNEGRSDRLPGSGVDLVKFKPVPLPGKSLLRFLLVARMLWDKGVGEFVAAARILRERGIDAEFCLLGFMDVQNPSAISRKQMDEWVAEGAVRYLGASDKVEKEIALADCVVLPSFYREGTPRALLEGAAMARPIVTTDSTGCRNVVEDGVNGYLCRPKDASDLADKMARVATMSQLERENMGLRGREKVEREFDENIVIAKYVEAISLILNRKNLVLD